MAADLLADRYRLERRLSKTAMADVWLADDGVLERRVVVKLLARDADLPRFEREARAAATLAHPNIVQVFDYGEDEGRPYMVLEYLRGGTLAERLPEKAALRDEETRQVAREIAAGLAHAHQHGVVHRDLKPGNVLFDEEGRAKVADFGIAHIAGADTLTEEGMVVGTAAYISPEQVASGPATPATDVYAFGVLLYRLLTGRFPFESSNALELARMHRDVDPPPIEAFRPDAPADLAALATAALAKDPVSRPSDGAALYAALGAEPPSPRLDEETATMQLPARGWRRRRRLGYAFAAVVLLAGGLLTAAIIAGSDSSAPAVPTRANATSTRSRGTTSTSTVPASIQSTTRATTKPTTTNRKPPATTTTPAPAPPPPTTVTTTTPSITVPTTTAATTGP
jgi:eukaryotic-like serine/threonine-protein kinase